MRVEAENGATAGKFDKQNVLKLLTLTLSTMTVHEWPETKLVTVNIFRRSLKEIIRLIYNINPPLTKGCWIKHILFEKDLIQQPFLFFINFFFLFLTILSNMIV